MAGRTFREDVVGLLTLHRLQTTPSCCRPVATFVTELQPLVSWAEASVCWFLSFEGWSRRLGAGLVARCYQFFNWFQSAALLYSLNFQFVSADTAAQTLVSLPFPSCLLTFALLKAVIPYFCAFEVHHRICGRMLSKLAFCLLAPPFRSVKMQALLCWYLLTWTLHLCCFWRARSELHATHSLSRPLQLINASSLNNLMRPRSPRNVNPPPSWFTT